MTLMVADKMSSIFDGTDTIYRNAQEMTKEEESKLLHIVNDTPLEFKEIISKSTCTSTKLSMMINEILHDLFSDYYGCELVVNEQGCLDVTLLFKAIPVVKGDDKRAFLPIASQQDQSNNQTLNRVMAINKMNAARHRTMEITPYGMEMLYDIMTSQNKKSVNIKNPETFKRFTGEIAEQAGMYSTVNNVYCSMIGIDIYRIMNIVFGQKDKQGRRYVYKVTAIRPVNPYPYANVGGRNNWVIEIERMTIDAFNELSRELGVMPIPGSITAVTETISSVK